MSNENSKALAIIPRTVDEVRSLAKMFAQSSLLPPDLRGKEADVFVSIMAGQELGLPPMAALRGVHVVKGKPVLSADTMVAIVLGSGLAEHFVCTDESTTSVTYETKRRGSPHPQRCTWSMEDAQRAGVLGNDNWKRYPRAMLKARCKAMLARDVYPDVLAGCYEADEARDFSSEPSTSPMPTRSEPDAIDAEIVSETSAPDAEPAAASSGPTNSDRRNQLWKKMNETKSPDELKGLVPMLSKLKGAERDEARRRYDAKMKSFDRQEGAA